VTSEPAVEPAKPALRTPPPLPARWVDAVPLVGLGTALWFVAFCGLLIAHLVFHTRPTEWIWTCLAGWLLGFAGFAVMFWQRSAARRGARGAQRV
jgi:uncharacterized RDD family membrane protein YckC